MPCRHRFDEPKYRERRIITAVETFEALRPGDAYEARLAVLIVLSGAHAAENLREAGVYREDFAKSSRCQAQAANMMRQERATRRILAQEQQVRLVRLAVEAVAGTAPIQSATASAPPPQAEPQAASLLAAVAAARLASVATTVAAPAPPPVQAGSAPPPSPEAIAQAEAFARRDIVAAAQIRHDRGITPQNKAYLRHLTLPDDPAVIDALVRGTSAVLTVLDDVGGADLDEVA